MRILLLVLFSFVMVQSVNADVWLLVEKSKKEVVSMSPENDAMCEADCEKIVIPGKLVDYPLQYHPTMYFYKNGRFVVNVKKLSDKAIDKEKKKNIKLEAEMIFRKARELAIKELKLEGKKIKYHNDDGSEKGE